MIFHFSAEDHPVFSCKTEKICDSSQNVSHLAFGRAIIIKKEKGVFSPKTAERTLFGRFVTRGFVVAPGAVCKALSGYWKEVCSPMDNRELAALHSKLVIYRNGLQSAKAKGDLDKARQWLEGIATLKKKIASGTAQSPHC